MTTETLGQVLQRYRKAERIKLEQAVIETKISKRVIMALENDDYERLPEDLYARQIIKNYASYLDLDYNKLLNLYQQGKKVSQADKKESKEKPVRVYMSPQIIRNILIAVIIVAVLSYLGWQVKQIFKQPELTIWQPAKNLIIQANFIEIKGQTEKEARVFINEKEIFLDPEGGFTAQIDLQKGLNIIKISSVKKHSQENVVFREILVE